MSLVTIIHCYREWDTPTFWFCSMTQYVDDRRFAPCVEDQPHSVNMFFPRGCSCTERYGGARSQLLEGEAGEGEAGLMVDFPRLDGHS